MYSCNVYIQNFVFEYEIYFEGNQFECDLTYSGHCATMINYNNNGALCMYNLKSN